MKSLVPTFPLFVLAIALPCHVAAQIDPDPDGIGIYFDTGATQVTTTAPPPAPGEFTEVEAWLIGTRISHVGDVSWWVGYITPVQLDDPENFQWCVWMGGGPTVGHNFAENMPGDPGHGYTVLLGPEEHLWTGPITILAHLLVLFTCEGEIPLFVGSASLYFRDGAELELHPSSGSLYSPAATINGDAPVSADTRTWGGVKRLFE